MDKPYIVSADIGTLLEKWSARTSSWPDLGRNTFKSPDSSFIEQMRGEFSAFMQSMFSAFDLVPEAELKEGIRRLVWQSGLPPVSLDRVYVGWIERDYEYPPTSSLGSGGHIVRLVTHFDLTRFVDLEGEDCFVDIRPNTPPFLQQLDRLRTEEVALIDDVVFSGALLERVIQALLCL